VLNVAYIYFHTDIYVEANKQSGVYVSTDNCYFVACCCVLYGLLVCEWFFILYVSLISKTFCYAVHFTSLYVFKTVYMLTNIC